MIIDLNELNYKDCINLDFEVKKDDRLDERIVDLKNCKVIGKIYNTETIRFIDIVFSGIMIIKDSVSLENIEYPFEIKIDDDLDELLKVFVNSYENSKNTLDILEFLWENIVLEVPISYTNQSDAKMSGSGWSLGNEDKESSIDPRLEKLKELLKGDD